jgi:hypothetical protein
MREFQFFESIIEKNIFCRPIQNSPTGRFLHLGLIRQINLYKTRSLIYYFNLRKVGVCSLK